MELLLEQPNAASELSERSRALVGTERVLRAMGTRLVATRVMAIGQWQWAGPIRHEIEFYLWCFRLQSGEEIHTWTSSHFTPMQWIERRRQQR